MLPHPHPPADTPLGSCMGGRSLGQGCKRRCMGTWAAPKRSKACLGGLEGPAGSAQVGSWTQPPSAWRQDTLDPGLPELCFVKGSKRVSEFPREISSLDSVGVKFIFLKRYGVFRSNKTLVF